MDIDKNKIDQLNRAIDPNDELSKANLQNKSIEYVSEPYKLRECAYIIVAVPTPITHLNEPDLTPLETATKMLGENLAQITTIIYESTVYPCTTEDVCIRVVDQY